MSDSSRYVARFSPSGRTVAGWEHGLSKANWTSLVNDLYSTIRTGHRNGKIY